MTVRFGDFLFDERAREPRRGAETVALSPKAFQLLAVLLDAGPRALSSRQELQDRLWPDTHVTHTSLPRVVKELRQSLGDDPKEERYVRTVHGYGYAFRGQAVVSDDRLGSGGAPLVPFNLLWGGRQIPLAEGDTLIGRDPECTVRIDSPPGVAAARPDPGAGNIGDDRGPREQERDEGRLEAHRRRHASLGRRRDRDRAGGPSGPGDRGGVDRDGRSRQGRLTARRSSTSSRFRTPTSSFTTSRSIRPDP